MGTQRTDAPDSAAVAAAGAAAAAAVLPPPAPLSSGIAAPPGVLCCIVVALCVGVRCSHGVASWQWLLGMVGWRSRSEALLRASGGSKRAAVAAGQRRKRQLRRSIEAWLPVLGWAVRDTLVKG